MIVLDTHVWVWWIEGNPSLKQSLREAIDAEQELAVSAISPWEVAMKASRGSMQLKLPIDRWMDLALTTAGIEVLPITPAIAIESTLLPGLFHKDPADRFIVATARHHQLALATQDDAILAYSHVRLIR